MTLKTNKQRGVYDDSKPGKPRGSIAVLNHFDIAKAIIAAIRTGSITGTRIELTPEQARFILHNTDITAWEKKR